MNRITLIIPAAGQGTRFQNAGISTPKPLIPVGQVPMILWVIYNFQLESDDEVIIIQRRGADLKQALEGFISKLEYKISFVEIPEMSEGPADSVRSTFAILPPNNAVIVANSDQFILTDLHEFVSQVRSGTPEGKILTMWASGPQWSYVSKQNGIVDLVKEKEEISNEATVGVYAWSGKEIMIKSFNAMFEANDRTNSEFYVAPSYNYLLKDGYFVSTFNIGPHGEYVHGLGTPEDLDNFKKLDIFGLQSKLVENYFINPETS
jgi:dTDP-glucose pyrophosphorylase